MCVLSSSGNVWLRGRGQSVVRVTAAEEKKEFFPRLKYPELTLFCLNFYQRLFSERQNVADLMFLPNWINIVLWAVKQKVLFMTH